MPHFRPQNQMSKLESIISRMNCVFFLGHFEKTQKLPYYNVNSPGLTSIGPPIWQAEADRELTVSASPATAVIVKNIW